MKTTSEDAISGTRDTLDPKYLEAMERLLEYTDPVPPDGSFTIAEAADQWGLAKNTASKKLLKMYRDGLLEKVEVGTNKIYYWFKD